MKNEEICERLQPILANELAGAMMYLHYSFYIYGHARIPITGWLREQASEGVDHATRVGDKIIALGGEPQTHPAHDMFKPRFDSLDDMLRQALQLEKTVFKQYADLLKEIGEEQHNVRLFLEEIMMEEVGHVEEIEAMLRPDVVHP